MTWETPSAALVALMLGALRAAAWLMICPPFSSRIIPMPVKALLAVGIALPMAPRLQGQVPSLETAPLIVSAAEQILVGSALGFLTYLLFASDGHQMVLRGFLLSYKNLPLDGTLSLETLSRLLSEGIDDMVLAALQIAGPLIAVLFLTDVAFGLLNRVAPALNAFSLGFPAKIFLTLALAGTAITALPRALDGLVDKAVYAVVSLTGG